MAAKRSVGVILRMWVDRYKQDAAEARRATEEVGKSGKRTKADLDQLAGTMTLLGGAMVAAAGVVIYATARFDKQMSEVKAVAGATAEEFGLLREAAIEAGAATAFSATEAAQAEAELAKAGVVAADILGGALTGSLALASAGTLDLATAATIAAQAMNIFGLDGQDVGHIADVLAAGANKSATSVQDLGIGLQQVGLVANQVGFSLEETVGVLAAFADNALGGSDGATSLKTALLRLAAPLPDAKAKMDELGISLYDANGQMVDAATIAGQLERAFDGMSDAERNAALATIFGQDAIRAANVLYKEGEDGIRSYIEAVDDNGAAARTAAEKMDNLAGDVEELTGSLETLFIKSGEGASGGLRILTQGATDLVNIIGSLPGPVQTAGVVIIGLTGLALLGAAAFIKIRGAVVALNTALVASGAAGAIAARGLRAATVAAGPLAIAALAVSEAIDLIRNGSGLAEKALKEIGRTAVDDVANQLGVAGKTLDETWSNVDETLAKMAMQGRGADALLMLADAAQQAGVPIELLTNNLPQFADAMQMAGDVTVEEAEGAREAAQHNIALAGAFGDAANEADGLKHAFDRLNGAMLIWRGTERDAEAAVDALQAALEESNGSMDITTEEGRAAAAAVDALAMAARDAAQAKYDEAVAQGRAATAVEEANAVYENYVGQLRDILINAGYAESEVDALIGKIAAMPTYKAITFDVRIGMKIFDAFGAGVQNALSLIANRISASFATGGIIQHAQTGLLREATIATRPMISWAEPSTGGEAFVPRNGDYSRSMGILGEAAGWYGADVVPRGTWGGGGGAASVVVNVTPRFGASRDVVSALLDAVRFDVDVNGGAVQTRLGQRGRVS